MSVTHAPSRSTASAGVTNANILLLLTTSFLTALEQPGAARMQRPGSEPWVARPPLRPSSEPRGMGARTPPGADRPPRLRLLPPEDSQPRAGTRFGVPTAGTLRNAREAGTALSGGTAPPRRQPYERARPLCARQALRHVTGARRRLRPLLAPGPPGPLTGAPVFANSCQVGHSLRDPPPPRHTRAGEGVARALRTPRSCGGERKPPQSKQI